MITRLRRAGLVVGAGAALGLPSVVAGQFAGPYAPAHWTFNANGGDGSIVLSAVPDAITLIGNDNGAPLINTDYTVIAAASGLWSFDWLVEHTDTGTYDTAYYLVNGAQFFLGSNQPPHTGSVSAVALTVGDVVGFRVHSSDGAFGAIELTISNFNAPVPAPGPVGATLGAAACVSTRRRRRPPDG